jgi:hypothetical protein
MQKNLSNLLNLQNLMKRSPQSYKEEFTTQLRKYEADRQILIITNAKQIKINKSFGAMVTFLAHVSQQKIINIFLDIEISISKYYNTEIAL